MIKNNKQQLPLYKQICELLHREITAGHWLPGDRLPVESELAASLSVAIGTLRKALSQLEAEGMLERRQGSGTYVKRAPTSKAVYQFFHLELLQGGGVPSADTLSVEMVENCEVAQQLDLHYLETKLWCIKRLRYLNNIPVAVEQIWIDHRHCDQLSSELLHESLYMHYREEFDFWITSVEDQISCEGIPQWGAKALKITQDTLMPVVQRKSRSNKNQLEEFSRTWYLSDQCRYFARWS
ncbi:MAG: GntR family transcriptional regulator [Oceanospirillaceae bacterium]|nr:GntR family transcriptional regulator [Oceanospirillaceae bacterium]